MNQDADTANVREQELAIDAMSRLLNALLDISKLESGAIKLELADFDVAALFDELRRDFGALAASKGLRSSIDTLHVACTRTPRWSARCCATSCQTPSSTRSKARWNCAARTTAAQAAVECATPASALRPNRSALMFEEFYQMGVAPNSSRDGYGLGLSIVQRIARLLGTERQVELEPGTGSVFSFELPHLSQPGRTRRRCASGVERRAHFGRQGRRASCWSKTSPACAMPCACCSSIEGYRRHRRGDGEALALAARRQQASICWSPTITSKTDARERR